MRLSIRKAYLPYASQTSPNSRIHSAPSDASCPPIAPSQIHFSPKDSSPPPGNLDPTWPRDSITFLTINQNARGNLTKSKACIVQVLSILESDERDKNGRTLVNRHATHEGGKGLATKPDTRRGAERKGHPDRPFDKNRDRSCKWHNLLGLGAGYHWNDDCRRAMIDNLADFFTKCQPPKLFRRMRDIIMNVPQCTGGRCDQDTGAPDPPASNSSLCSVPGGQLVVLYCH